MTGGNGLMSTGTAGPSGATGTKAGGAAAGATGMMEPWLVGATSAACAVSRSLIWRWVALSWRSAAATDAISALVRVLI